MTLDEEINRGAKAAALLRDPMLLEAFVTLEEVYTDAWRDSPLNAAEDRELIYHYLSALKDVRGHLEQVVITGELAAGQRDALMKTRLS